VIQFRKAGMVDFFDLMFYSRLRGKPIPIETSSQGLGHLVQSSRGAGIEPKR